MNGGYRRGANILEISTEWRELDEDRALQFELQGSIIGGSDLAI
jgi:hypothetical protein